MDQSRREDPADDDDGGQGIGFPWRRAAHAAPFAAAQRWRVRRPVSSRALHRRRVMTGSPKIRTRQIHWSWEGRELSLGVDEAGSGPSVLLLPALSSISTRREMHPLMKLLGKRSLDRTYRGVVLGR